MKYSPDIHHRRSIRLKGYDYSPLQKTGIARMNDYSRKNGTSKTIGSIIRGLKIGVTKWFRKNTDIHAVWQRNYYEHIIRNEKSFYQISQYIQTNLLKWQDDKYYV